MDSFTSNIAADGIRKAGSFQDMAEWFASAFDFGPAVGRDNIASVAKNIDAIHGLAQKFKQAQAIYNDESADLEDRIDATQLINQVAGSNRVRLPNGNTVNDRQFATITGLSIDVVKPLMSGDDYSDMKLVQFKEQANTVAARAGVAPQSSIQRIKDIQAEIDAAMAELNAKTGPLCNAWQARFNDALESIGYNAKKKDSLNLIEYYRHKQDELANEKPRSYDPYDSEEERQDRQAKYEEWALKTDKLHEERTRAFATLQAEMRTLYDKANNAAGDLNSEIGPFNKAYNEFVARKREEQAEARTFADKLRTHVLESSPVTQEVADQWFNDMVMIPKNIQANLKKRGYTPEKLKADMTEFYRLTGGRLSRVSLATKGGQRAAAQPTTGVVYVAGTFSKQIFFHELAHVLEDDERTRALANRFLDHRTERTEDGKNKVVSLASLTGNSGYKRDEVAYKDSFIDPYVGKYYRDRITEVFSMGMQYFNSPESMAVLAEKDPDHFNLMLGYMTTLPRLNNAKVEQQQAAMTEQKETTQSTEEFLKTMDKKIAKAGDFWTTEGFTIESYKSWRGGTRWYASWPGTKEGTRSITSYMKSEKLLKRVLWMFISAGKPADGDLSIQQLSWNYSKKMDAIPKDIYQNQALIEGPQGAAQ